MRVNDTPVLGQKVKGQGHFDTNLGYRITCNPRMQSFRKIEFVRNIS